MKSAVLKKDRSNGYYYARVNGPSGATWQSMKTKNAKEAARRASDAGIVDADRDTLVESIRQKASMRASVGRNITLSEARDRWLDWLESSGSKSPKTVTNYRDVVNAFISYGSMERRSVASLDSTMINNWINRKDWGAKRTTRFSAMAAIRKWCEWMNFSGMIDGSVGRLCAVNVNALPQAQKETRHHRAITPDEYGALLCILDQARTPFYGIAARLSWETGLRLSDVATLEWESWEWNTRGDSFLIVWTRKRSRRVKIPLTEGLCEIYDMIPEVVGDSRFCFPDEAQVALDPDNKKLNVFFGRAFKKADIKDGTFHGLRASFAQRMRQEGRNDNWIKDILGHSNMETTRGYLEA